ncbi:MAG: hypothetical protein AAFY28_18385, partial [Actinomycetota bacterium]
DPAGVGSDDWAVVATGGVFEGWSGAHAGAASTTLTLDPNTPTSLTAEFAPSPFTGGFTASSISWGSIYDSLWLQTRWMDASDNGDTVVLSGPITWHGVGSDDDYEGAIDSITLQVRDGDIIDAEVDGYQDTIFTYDGTSIRSQINTVHGVEFDHDTQVLTMQVGGPGASGAWVHEIALRAEPAAV